MGCRAKRPQPELLRFRRRPDGRVVPAIPRPGRQNGAWGRCAYLCPSRKCFDVALRRRAFARSLAGPQGLSVSLDATTLWGVNQDELSEEEHRLRRGGKSQSRRAIVLANLLQGLRAPSEGDA